MIGMGRGVFPVPKPTLKPLNWGDAPLNHVDHVDHVFAPGNVSCQTDRTEHRCDITPML